MPLCTSIFECRNVHWRPQRCDRTSATMHAPYSNGTVRVPASQMQPAASLRVSCSSARRWWLGGRSVRPDRQAGKQVPGASLLPRSPPLPIIIVPFWVVQLRTVEVSTDHILALFDVEVLYCRLPQLWYTPPRDLAGARALAAAPLQMLPAGIEASSCSGVLPHAAPHAPAPALLRRSSDSMLCVCGEKSAPSKSPATLPLSNRLEPAIRSHHASYIVNCLMCYNLSHFCSSSLFSSFF